MKDESRKRRKWIARLLLFPLLWLGYHGITSLVSIQKLKRSKRDLQSQIQSLMAREQVLESKKRFLESDSGLSVLAITRLGMEKAGQKVYRVDVVEKVDEGRVEP
jgi:cell division protein FtsB